MTITDTMFAKGWGVLAARWKNDATPALQAVYFEQLDAEMDDDTFVAAVKLIVRNQRFFPSIQEIIDAATPPADVDAEAAEVFRAILNNPLYLPTRGSFFNAHTVQERHGVVAAHAFVASGGERRWNAITDADTPFALRDFASAYRLAKGEERARGQLEQLGVKPPKLFPSKPEAQKMLADGLATRLMGEVNEVRERFGLPPVEPPEKNRKPKLNGVEAAGDVAARLLAEVKPE